ncbi:MAG: long-chain fatty acid--CoA ligase [Acidiferrobacteraceae bacterium]|jgi:long-chain acyl-CoA synthetase|nr:long-chain fatty acid--CoA ligase [Acidiferrobacteraceae bacterium]MBT3640434.1 long-chain fatty acid--CoA ligase [Acidiferrobacteraceae bacterium]MBT3769348.1 long-chain fatty acid--CoA ligase [Acidiferrobacteraceae bacterium]MBT3973253.1 long-chain fatty acid--CoA ligase [Acidiferrobacteraceae bacterium]MBT4806500.1 long-chain fatty acid--CoA ligase [Acidiferrobacteraceae bacterium]
MEATTHPWLSNYPEGIDWSASIERRPLYETLERTAERCRDNTAIDFLDYCLSYGELLEQVNHMAKGLQLMGVTPGARVGLCLPNTPYSVICYYGALRAGATVVNYNPLYVERELAFQIDDSNTEIMITMDLEALYPKVAAMLSRTESLKKIIVCPMAAILPKIKSILFRLLKRKEIANIEPSEAIVHFQDLLDNDGDPTQVNVDLDNDIAVLQYTGGTTGRPKGAMLTQGNLSANVSQMLLWYVDLNPGEEKVLGVLPFFHVFAMTAVMNFAVAAGAQMILLPRYELGQTLATINKKKPTIFPAVPTIYTAINQAPDLAKYDLSAVRYCISGGAPLPLEVKETFERLTGCRLVEGYGLSETAPVATCNAMQDINKPGSIGQVVPGTEISIHDLEAPNDVVPTGERGEVWIKGPQVMKGYLNRPQETADSLREGWFRTGDVGYMDEDGHFFLVDRLKDLILCSGYNVYPRMVEEAIYLHPAVAEVTVIGIDDDYRGQSPKAFVKLKEGEKITEDEMKTFLADKLSKIEMPSQIEFRLELPKTIIGKLSKKELVAEEVEKHKGSSTS